ncbi:alpha/beta hydrolase [Limnoraphis robusta]|nr:alpha/beta hydrolase [Limnoraphis robusta]
MLSMATIKIHSVGHAYDLTEPIDGSNVVVFIHGWLLSRRYWQPVIDRLKPQYQCLCYDLRGFGDSQLASRHPYSCDYAPASYAQDLGILLEELNISKAWLVGHSLGGTIALLAAQQLSDRIAGVVCVNAGGGIYLKEEFERFRVTGEQIVKFRPRWLCCLPLIDLLFTRAQVASPVSREWGRQRLIDFVMADPEAALGALLDSTTETEVHRLPQVVAQLQQPEYFLAGMCDQIMEPQYVRHLASFHHLFRSGYQNVIELANCGHLAMIEQPEQVVGHLRDILAQHGSTQVQPHNH